MFVRHSSSKELKVSGCPTRYEEQSRTKVSSYSTLKAYSQGDSLTRKQEDPFPAFQRNASMPWIPLKCIEPQIPLDTKKKCLLANFCMGLQKLGTFEVGSRPATILILNFEEVAMRRTKKKRQRSTFKGFERYCEAPFAPGSALQHHCILPPAASFALVSQNSPLLIPSRSWVGPWKKILVLLSFQWPKQNVAG